LNLGYSKLSRIISGYIPPDPARFCIIDSNTPEEHSELLKIGTFMVSDVEFEVFEGSGGHLYGEMVFVSRKYGILFTGDNLVNISGFSPERAEFNSLAPYLMRSVNVDSHKATEVRKQILQMAGQISRENGKPCIICGGHGPVSLLTEKGLNALPGDCVPG
jgi:glyoxylase-like metal-dependent hydrolase (beta-lactamase superfamily II)